MKKEEIKQLADNDLVSKIAEEKEGLRKLKINHAVSSIENPMKIRANRKLVAKLITELNIRNAAKK